jgi:hypothetical protein
MGLHDCRVGRYIIRHKEHKKYFYDKFNTSGIFVHVAFDKDVKQQHLKYEKNNR